MAPEGPEQALKNYINYRFSSSQTKGKLLEMSTGNVQAQIAVMDEEGFEKYYNTSDKKLKVTKK